MIDVATQDGRKKLIDEIKNRENVDRKKVSLKQLEIYRDRLHKYVVDYLRENFSIDTVKEMPVVSSINLTKRIIDQEASIYKDEPIRSFHGVDDDQIEVLNAIYDDMQINTKLMKSNRLYKLQNQNLVQVILKDGAIKLRSLWAHHYDAVPSSSDPEIADVYVLSAMDKEYFLDTNDYTATGYRGTGKKDNVNSDKINQSIGDPDDYKASLDRYVVWSTDQNFIMDGKGNILSEDDINEIGMLPFIDIAEDKDFEYFVRQNQSSTDFTIQYNAALSDLGQVVRLQGWSQAFIKGPESLMFEKHLVGPQQIVKLPIEEGSSIPVDFGFANPSSDIAGSIQYIEVLLSNYLTSKGIEPNLISGKGNSTKFTSGVERLLSMIEKFEASRSDLAMYRYVEDKIFDLVRRYHNTYVNTDLLDDKYKTREIPMDAYVTVEYKKPEMIQSEAEKLDSIEKKLDLGLISQVDAIAEYHGIEKTEAEKMLSEMEPSLAIEVEESQ